MKNKIRFKGAIYILAEEVSAPSPEPGKVMYHLPFSDGWAVIPGKSTSEVTKKIRKMMKPNAFDQKTLTRVSPGMATRLTKIVEKVKTKDLAPEEETSSV